MRSLSLLVFTACALQGCTALGAGVAADLNRQRRVRATTTGASLAERPPVPGDRLTLHMVSGDSIGGAFVSLSPDSLTLADAGTFALRDVDGVERTWERADALPLVIGALADFVVLGLVSRNPRNPFSF